MEQAPIRGLLISLQYSQYLAVSGLLTWVQLLDIFLAYGNSARLQPLCGSAVLTSSSLLSTLYASIALIGWHSAWYNVFLFILSRQTHSSVLAFMSPIGVAYSASWQLCPYFFLFFSCIPMMLVWTLWYGIACAGAVACAASRACC